VGYGCAEEVGRLRGVERRGVVGGFVESLVVHIWESEHVSSCPPGAEER